MRRVAAISAGPRSESPRGNRAFSLLFFLSPLMRGLGCSIVMRGRDPRIHAEVPHVRKFTMDCRVKPGNDEERVAPPQLAAGRIAGPPKRQGRSVWHRECHGNAARAAFRIASFPFAVAFSAANRFPLRRKMLRLRLPAQEAPMTLAEPRTHAIVPNDLEPYWLPFTANRAFKKSPRLLV